MHKNKLILLGINLLIGCLLGANQEPKETVSLEVRAFKNAQVPLLIGCIGELTDSLRALAQTIQRDLSFTDQFAVSIKPFEQVPTKNEFKELSDSGISLVVFLSRQKGDSSIEWRLYDTQTPSMIKGKRYISNSSLVRAQGHAIADLLWPELTGQEGFFSSRVAYCKVVNAKSKRQGRQIIIADYDGSNEEVIVGTKSVKVAPRWNRDKVNPLLSYSECRRSNTVLMYTTMAGKRYRAVDFDGINMLLAFSEAGDKAVYCSSRGRGHCQIYYCGAGIYKQITNNEGNNISPVLSADGNLIYFCSDYKRESPGIFTFDLKTQAMELLVGDGYCVSPALSVRANKLAYAKMVHGTLQIFVCNLTTGIHEQLTHGAGDKEECSWSPCGNYLLYSVCKGNKNRIAMLSLATKTERFITPANENCSYPAWSPVYEKFPVVNNNDKIM